MFVINTIAIELITIKLFVFSVIDVVGYLWISGVIINRFDHVFSGRMIKRIVTDDCHRSMLATADTWCRDYPNVISKALLQRCQQGCAPANSQLSESQTPTVNGDGGVSPSLTTSKRW